mmetsp:Transcript_58221/g.155560  ORF Transcript_58221/g.155560 Transcript_58221/m.155560 type:complete len:252 (+) Transcript_58221:91-846(+)
MAARLVLLVDLQALLLVLPDRGLHREQAAEAGEEQDEPQHSAQQAGQDAGGNHQLHLQGSHCSPGDGVRGGQSAAGALRGVHGNVVITQSLVESCGESRLLESSCADNRHTSSLGCRSQVLRSVSNRHGCASNLLEQLLMVEVRVGQRHPRPSLRDHLLQCREPRRVVIQEHHHGLGCGGTPRGLLEQAVLGAVHHGCHQVGYRLALRKATHLRERTAEVVLGGPHQGRHGSGSNDSGSDGDDTHGSSAAV